MGNQLARKDGTSAICWKVLRGTNGTAFTYQGADHLGTLSHLAGHLALVTHAELTGRALPHFILVPQDPTG